VNASDRTNAARFNWLRGVDFKPPAFFVRFLEVPDDFLLRDRSASRMANSVSSRTDRRTFRWWEL